MSSQRNARPSATPDDESRKARKRATDRRAQKEHRLRQKAYVKQLEETVERLNAGTQDEIVRNLVAEREQLQKRCEDLKLKLDRVRDLVCDDRCTGQHESHVSGVVPSGDPPSKGPGTTAREVPDEPTWELTRSSVASNDASEAPGWNNEDPAITRLGASDMRADKLFEQSPSNYAAAEHTQQNCVAGRLEDSTFTLPEDNFPELRDDVSTSALLAEVLNDHENLGHSCADPLSTSGTELVPIGSVSSLANASSLDLGPLFPRYSAPRAPVDQILWNMLQEARNEHLCGRFDTTEPSLARLLSAAPVDTLSFRLFHHISRFGPAPLHVVLAVFWTQYLVLRWHVLQTPEAYEMVPEFLRPSAIERRIPHRFFIGMLVWPEVREYLLRDADLVDPESVGIEAMRNLESNWSPTSHDRMAASLDVLDIVEKQACSLEFWKLNRAFLNKFPQFLKCVS